MLVVYVLVAIGLWRTFSKAGIPGILGIIPIVNIIFLLRVAGMSMWLAILYIVPIANLILLIVVAIKVGAELRKGRRLQLLPAVAALADRLHDPGLRRRALPPRHRPLSLAHSIEARSDPTVG